jgi:hypothetical protein
VFENLLTSLTIRMQDAGPTKRMAFRKLHRGRQEAAAKKILERQIGAPW